MAAGSASWGVGRADRLAQPQSPHIVRSQYLEEAGRVGSSRPTASMGAVIQFHARLGHTIWKEVVVAAVQVYWPLAGSGWSCKNARRVGRSSLGFGLLGRRARQEAKSTTFQVRIAVEKINAGLPLD